MSGALLLSALLLLSQGRAGVVVALCAAQGALLAAAAALAGHWPAAAVFAAQAVLLPWWLRRHLPPAPLPDALGALPALLVGGLVLVLAIGAAPAAAAVPRETLAPALAMLLLGMLSMAVRRHPLAQAAGGLTAVNAALLLALAAGLPGLWAVVLGAQGVVGALFGRLALAGAAGLASPPGAAEPGGPP